MTRVSVVIPNRNYARWLPEAVESVVRQTHESLELWIVDDGSEDGSAAAARRLWRIHHGRFARFEILELDTPGGKLGALNRALPLVGGDASLVLDADDALLETYVQDTLRLLAGRARHRRTDLTYTDCWLVDALGRRLGRGRSRAFDGELLKTSSFIPGCALVRTDALRAALPFDERILIGEKHHRWLRVCAAGAEAVHLPRALFRYRMHDGNQSGIGRRVLARSRASGPLSLQLAGEWIRSPESPADLSAVDAP